MGRAGKSQGPTHLRIYRALLLVYPRRFRERYGQEMTRLFDDRYLEAHTRRARAALCVATVWDVIRNGISERARRRAGRRDHAQSSGLTTVGESAIWHLRSVPRLLLRGKGINAAAAGILSLGVGMSLAIFTLVDAVLIRPLPFPHQEDLYLIWKVDPLAGAYIEEMAYPELHDLQENLGELEYAALLPNSLYGYARVLQVSASESVQLESALVSHDFFRVLGVPPAMGRDFLPEDERVGAAPVAVVSDRVWREYLSADPDVIGRRIRLNGQAHTVVGIMAAGAEFPRGAELWLPLGFKSRS